MDRVAQLAAEAEQCLRFEKEWTRAGKGLAAAARCITIECLTEAAESLGFPESEISSAIDTALGGGR